MLKYNKHRLLFGIWYHRWLLASILALWIVSLCFALLLLDVGENVLENDKQN